MIFVTVGGQLPFDRLVRAVDEWAGACGRGDVFAQIGRGAYTPQHVAWAAFLEPAEFARRAREAACIVAHAGIGTIITALEHGTPVLVMPRRHALHEQRNDHQLATAERLRGREGVRVAMDELELARELAEVDRLPAAARIGGQACAQLLERLRGFADEALRAKRGRA